jgi:hypothetical protein
MKNKKFKDLSNDRIVKVTDQFEDIIILDGRNKIKINQLMDKRLFEEYVDPSSFFRNDNLINSFAEQIKKIPLDDWNSRIPSEEMGFKGDELIPNMNESAVLPYDPEIEKQELLKKAQTVYNMGNTNTLVQKQMDALKDILEGDEDIINININNSTEIDTSTPQQVLNQNIKQEIKEEKRMDPITEMFKNVKRNTSFKIEFTVENKIPRVDFIEMMEDSYNTSIIDFLAQEFTEDILNDPDKIKERIKNKLMDLVYPEVENKKKFND